MKKFFIVFVICALAISATYLVTHYNINFQNITDEVSNFFSNTFGTLQNQKIEDLQVNSLQPKNSTYHYNQLDDNQKKMYLAIGYAVRDLKPIASVNNYAADNIDLISQDAKKVMTAFFADHPEVFYLDLTYKLSLSRSVLANKIQIELTYSVTSINDLYDKISQIQQVIDSYINNTNNMTDFNKEVYLHDSIAKDTKYYTDITNIYDIPEEYHTIYGVFIKKQGVCDGFAKSMQILLDRVDIENIFVTGMLSDTAHAWNMVKMDGEWYHLDVTSDKNIKEPDGTTKIPVHTYFNVTDQFILQSHTIDDKELNPVAAATKDNYFIKTNAYISSTDNFEERIKEIVQAESQNNALEFSTDLFDVPDKLLKVLYDINFNNYKTSNGSVKMKYYNEYNTFIIPKE